MKIDTDAIYEQIKKGPAQFNPEVHCPLILKVMANEGRVSAFCMKAMCSESGFYKWVQKHEFFRECYAIGKILAREIWEIEGIELRDREMPIGMIDHAYDHWKMIGWSRFGISRNSRIKINLDANGTPLDHYKQVLKQASEGDFTASEIKQLMEAVNVGLNTHQVFELQKEIDQLKSDLLLMAENSNVKNSVTNTRVA